MALTGTHLVRGLRSAFQKARKTWPATRHRMEVRRQSLKLRFWGEQSQHNSETNLLDLTYETIKSLQGMGIYELRLDDNIGGHSNVRVIFFIPPKSWIPTHTTPLPTIWILEAIPKKRDEWTTFDIKRFKALRAVVKERFFETQC